MNNRQAKVLQMLSAPLRQTEFHERNLYEGFGDNARGGSGLYWVTHSAGETYEPITHAEVLEMERAGLITEVHPGLYKRSGPAAAMAEESPA